MSTTPGRKFFDEQVAYLAAKDVNGLIENHYAPDGVLLSFGAVAKGTAALKQHFQNYMQMLGYIKLLTVDKYVETDEAIFFEATVETKLGVAHVYDAFVLKDGKATHHFTGLK